MDCLDARINYASWLLFEETASRNLPEIMLWRNRHYSKTQAYMMKNSVSFMVNYAENSDAPGGLCPRTPEASPVSMMSYSCTHMCRYFLYR
jgi:hypothetical protein